MQKFFILVLFVISFQANSQDHLSLVQLSGGLSTPIGDFGNADFNNSSSGYAKSGFNGEVIFQHHLSKFKYLGYTASVRYQSYSFDADAITAGFFNQLTEATKWTSTSVLVGPVWTFPIFGKFYVEPRAMIGVAFINSPTITTYFEGYPTEYSSQSSTSFTYLAGFNFRYDLAKHISVMLREDFQSAKPTGYDAANATTTSVPMNTLNTSIGVAYRFN